ncbi:type II toxin-antitoxin system PemK/MazF family toxin [bacterium]|nr:type II toxin-antitoxin system PemK/MazF family toxin [bacterium]
MTITNTRRFYRGEIWTTIAYAFPHERDEYVTPRERPVLIVQNDEDNAASGYPIVLIAPITTRKLDRIYIASLLYVWCHRKERVKSAKRR